MVFSSLNFILLFMPPFFAVYYLARDRAGNAVLLLGSLIFYLIGTIGAPLHFVILIVSIVLDFYLALAMERWQRIKKPLFVCGICFHLICLGIFKYAGFVLAELGRLVPELSLTAELVLPIGISFYTFQSISYLADVYRGKVKPEESLRDYAVYISMFEQLIAGPIVTYGQVRDALHKRELRRDAVIRGFGVFVFGLGLKVLLANPLGKLWAQTQAIGFESISTPLAWMAIFAYSFELYFDFFGYSLMALGLGEMLGFELPKNFDHPYTSISMTQFWRRWHMTLGSWFREYVYIPLGGNRKGKLRTVLNLLVVWLLTGIWHGAGYNFLLWGFVLFLLIVIEKLCIGDFLSAHPIVGHAYMLLAIPLTWAVFAVTDIEQLKILFARLFPFFGQGPWSVFRYDYLKYLGQYWAFFAAAAVLSFRQPYRLLERLRKPCVIWAVLLVILLASLYCMYRGFDDPFLYLRF